MSRIQELENTLVSELGPTAYADWDGEAESLPSRLRALGVEMNSLLPADEENAAS